MARWKIQTDWVLETDSWLIFNFPDGDRSVHLIFNQDMPAAKIPFKSCFDKMIRLLQGFIRSSCLCCIQCEWIDVSIHSWLLLLEDNPLIATNQDVHWYAEKLVEAFQQQQSELMKWSCEGWLEPDYQAFRCSVATDGQSDRTIGECFG